MNLAVEQNAILRPLWPCIKKKGYIGNPTRIKLSKKCENTVRHADARK